jgi:hypothetical protein
VRESGQGERERAVERVGSASEREGSARERAVQERGQCERAGSARELSARERERAVRELCYRPASTTDLPEKTFGRSMSLYARMTYASVAFTAWRVLAVSIDTLKE